MRSFPDGSRATLSPGMSHDVNSCHTKSYIKKRFKRGGKCEIGRIWSHQKSKIAVTSMHKRGSAIWAMRHGEDGTRGRGEKARRHEGTKHEARSTKARREGGRDKGTKDQIQHSAFSILHRTLNPLLSHLKFGTFGTFWDIARGRHRPDPRIPRFA